MGGEHNEETHVPEADVRAARVSAYYGYPVRQHPLVLQSTLVPPKF
jgi:hypothetical protein